MNTKKPISRSEAYKASKKRKRTAVEPKPEPSRHPDDIALEKEAVEKAAVHIDAFIAKVGADKLKSLIQTYADASAERQLAELREEFWTSIPFDPV